MLAPWKKSYDQPREHIKKQRHYVANKGLYSQIYCFSSSHMWMWELDHKESWMLKNWFFLTGVLEETLQSPLDYKKIKLVNPKCKTVLNIHWKGWCWSSNSLATCCKNRLIRKDSDTRKDWRQEEKGATENERVGWHHRLNGHEFEQALGDSEGQGNLVCYSPWGRKESDMIEQLNNKSSIHRILNICIYFRHQILGDKTQTTFIYKMYILIIKNEKSNKRDENIKYLGTSLFLKICSHRLLPTYVFVIGITAHTYFSTLHACLSIHVLHFAYNEAMPKKAQTTAQLNSSHTLVK